MQVWWCSSADVRGPSACRPRSCRRGRRSEPSKLTGCQSNTDPSQRIHHDPVGQDGGRGASDRRHAARRGGNCGAPAPVVARRDTPLTETPHNLFMIGNYGCGDALWRRRLGQIDRGRVITGAVMIRRRWRGGGGPGAAAAVPARPATVCVAPPLRSPPSVLVSLLLCGCVAVLGLRQLCRISIIPKLCG